MTDDALNKLAEPAARKAAALPRWLVTVLAALLAVFVLCAAGATWVLVSQHNQITALDQRADQSDSDAHKLADQVKGLGAVPVVEPPASAVSPAEPATVDSETVRNAARSAVLEYCAQPNQPCRGLDGASPNVDAIVAQVVAKIPIPKDGTNGQDAPPVTGSQLLAAVTQYCAQPDEPCRGANGANGQTPPCMSEASQCQGADGRGVVSHEYLLVDGQCVERTYYTEDPSPVDVPVGAALCESSTPTTTTPTETP